VSDDDNLRGHQLCQRRHHHRHLRLRDYLLAAGAAGAAGLAAAGAAAGAEALGADASLLAGLAAGAFFSVFLAGAEAGVAAVAEAATGATATVLTGSAANAVTVARVAIRVTIDFMLSFLFGWSRNFYPYIYITLDQPV